MTERTIQIPNDSFTPNDKTYIPQIITIQKNDTITWTNNDSKDHTVSSGTPEDGTNNKFESNLIKVGEIYSHIFEEVGTFDYFCNSHPWKKGQIIVE